MTLLLGGPLTGKTTRLADAYRQHLAAGRSPHQILCLSFFSANAAALRRELRPQAGDFLPWVTTLQRFETLLLRLFHYHARLPRRAREIEPGARALLLRHAWAQTGGGLWQTYHASPAATTEFTRVVDWISANRTGFAPRPGELGDHELARAYLAYLDLCERHRLLTFQEASLRCLDLLALPEVAAGVRRRFPILLVDDVHHARPDQLRLLDRLRTLAAETLVTAWLEPHHHAPELRFAWDMLQSWASASAPIERLTPPPAVNPLIPHLALRLTNPPPASPLPSGDTVPGGSPHLSPLPFQAMAPVAERSGGRGAGGVRSSLLPTVEAEVRAAAAAIARTLAADPALPPEAVALLAPPDLLPFAERVLAAIGLPVAPRPLPAAHTPLIRTALLALRWVRHPRQRAALEAQLLELPLLPLDPLDRHALLRAAGLNDQPPLALATDEQHVALSAPGRAALVQLSQALSALDPAQPASVLADAALAALHTPAWLQSDRAFTPAERQDWERAYVDWRRLVRELEDFVARGLPAPDDWDAHLEALAEQVSRPSANGGLRLVPLHLPNGVRARHAFVLGLSENASPRLAPEMQLIAEADLPQLLPPLPLLPLARHHPAWIEREARSLAAALTRGTDTLWLSTSRHAATGDAQLPSPFFERLLGPDGALDRDGGLVFHTDTFQNPTTHEAPPPPDVDTILTHTPPTSTYTPSTFTPSTSTPAHASASQLRAYLTCPLQYFYQRVLGLETEGSSAMDRGGLIHELLCVTAGDGATRAVRLWDRPRPSWLNSPASLNERALVALEAAWRGEAADLPGGDRYAPAQAWAARFGPELQRQAVRQWVERVLKRWADYEVGALGGPRRPVLLETEFEFGLGPHRLRGRIDRIDEVLTPAGPIYEVIDYKTGSGNSLSKLMGAFLPPEGEPAADYQLPLYALALMHGQVLPAPAAPRRLHFLYVENMEPGKKGKFSATACRTLELPLAGAVDPKQGVLPLPVLANEVVLAIQSTLDQMARPPWPARPGRYCEYCSFRAACDRGQETESL